MSILALDIDSVMFPINEELILPALRRAGMPYEMKDITDFDYRKCLGQFARDVAYNQFKRHDLYDYSVLQAPVRTALKLLRAEYTVLAVSSPFQQHASSKWDFMRREGFSDQEIVLCGNKALVDVDLLIDDRPNTCRMVGHSRCVVFDQPWNQNVSEYFERVYNWEDVPEMVARFLQ